MLIKKLKKRGKKLFKQFGFIRGHSGQNIKQKKQDTRSATWNGIRCRPGFYDTDGASNQKDKNQRFYLINLK